MQTNTGFVPDINPNRTVKVWEFYTYHDCHSRVTTVGEVDWSDYIHVQYYEFLD